MEQAHSAHIVQSAIQRARLLHSVRESMAGLLCRLHYG